MARRPENSKNKNFFSNIFVTGSGRYFDYSLLFIVLFLVVFGLVMLYSTSSYTAELKTGDSTFYLRRQGCFALLGIVGMLIISKINYSILKIYSKIMLIIIGLLLFATLFIGSSSHGAVRWIQIGPIQFQPSEVAKIVIIIFTAHIATVYSARIGDVKTMLKTIIVQSCVAGLIAIENLSTGIICMTIIVMIVFVTSPKIKPFIVLVITATCAMIPLLLIASYRLERIKIWRHPEKYEKGYQTLQSLYAIGSGGMFGKGLGQSMQKLGFIPESHNDMIFSVICEELGLFGAICVIFLFLMLIWRCVMIALSAEDLFGSLLVVGVITHISVQVIINIAVVTNTFPPTGVPLPFFSYGGTALVILLSEIGLVLSVARKIKLPKEY